MAKLLSYYRLCPLIDSKNLLGIAEDSKKGFIVVTLGKNIAIKYKLSDQKQICSWRSKDKFSSPVLYDKSRDKYVATFNKLFIRFWTEEDENLGKIKKMKFTHQIESILIHNDTSYIFFKSGSLYLLDDIIDQRDSFIPKTIIESNEEFYDFFYSSLGDVLYFGFIIKKSDETFKLYWSKFDKSTNNIFTHITLQRENNVTLKGYLMHKQHDSVVFLTVWSDRKIYRQELASDKTAEPFAIVEHISVDHLVKLVDIDENYIGIYGADPNEEGAILLIYNVNFKVTQSKQYHKLYTSDSRIWRAFNHIILPVSQYLFVVPFLLETEQLSSLIGSHKLLNNSTNKDDNDVIFATGCDVVTWFKSNEQKSKEDKMAIPKLLEAQVQEQYQQGLPDVIILEQLLPETLEENNLILLKNVLEYFIDIPEKLLAKVLSFVLRSSSHNYKSDLKQSKRIKFNNLPKSLNPKARLIFLDSILMKSFNNVPILPYLRTELSVEHSILLLEYLLYMLSNDGHKLPSMSELDTERTLINWMSIIIDANYQRFLLSKDKHIDECLVKCKETVSDYLEAIDELDKVAPHIKHLEQQFLGKSFNNGCFNSNSYCVEQVNWY